jgi:hypothetical protein
MASWNSAPIIGSGPLNVCGCAAFCAAFCPGRSAYDCTRLSSASDLLLVWSHWFACVPWSSTSRIRSPRTITSPGSGYASPA